MKQEKIACMINLTNSNGEYIILICLWGVSPIRLRKLKAGIIKKISVMKSFLYLPKGGINSKIILGKN